jgi:hypothetical protein
MQKNENSTHVLQANLSFILPWHFQMCLQSQKIRKLHDKAPTCHSRNEQ